MVEQDWTAELSVLEGHTDGIRSVAFSPTDNLVVSTSGDNTARLWDYITSTERFKFDERKYYLCAAFSPDGKSVALGSNDGLISVREIRKGSVIDLKGHASFVLHVVFSPKSGKILASTAVDDTVRIWNIDERQTTHVCCFPADGRPGVAEFTPDGRFLIVGSRGSMTMWNVDNGECVRTFDDVDTTHVDAIAISMDGKKAALTPKFQTVCLFDLSTGKQQFEASYDVNIVSISLLPPDEDFVLIATESGDIELRDIRNWSVVRQFHIPHAAIRFAVSRDGELLVSGGQDHTLRLWDMRSSAVGDKVPDRGFDLAYYLRFSSDDSLIISNTIREPHPHVWDATDGSMKVLPVDHVREIDSSPDGRYIVLKLYGGVCQLWNKSMTTQVLDSKRLGNIVFSPDSNCMALVSIDGGIEIVNSTTFREMMTLEAFHNAKVEFSPNGQIVVLSNSDPKTKELTSELWNLPCRKRLLVTTLEYPANDYPRQVNFSPNGQMVAFRSAYSEIEHKGSWKLLEIVTGKEEWIHGDGYLVFHSDSHLIAVETRDSDGRLHTALYITTYETSSLESKHKLKLPGPVGQWCTFWSMTTPTIPTTGKLVTASSREGPQWRSQTVNLWDTTTGLEIGRYTIEGNITNLSFFDDKYLVCDQGRLPVPFALPGQNKTDSKEKQEDAQDCLFVGSQWVYQGLERILWLPPAYRSQYSVLRGETLALAHESATVRIVKFNLAETPVSTVRQSGVHMRA